MILRSEHLVKFYGKRQVVRDVSIEVLQGEIVGLLGPNGAGKTTTFYMTVGFIKPDEGNVHLNDENITDLPMYKRAQKASATCRKNPLYFANSAWNTTSVPYWR